jgi:hypothetical protein
MTEAWKGILSGSVDRIYVGAHVIDPSSGQTGQVVEVLSENEAVVRLPDGALVTVSPT